MRKDLSEVLVGALVFFLGILLFVLVQYIEPDTEGPKDTYQIKAKFNRTDGIDIGSSVRLAGIQIGTVFEQELDKNYRTIVTFQIDKIVQLPEDTAAVIHTDGLFGEKYIELEPGGMEEIIKPGGYLTYTQGSMVVQELLAKIIAVAKSNRNKNKKKEEVTPEANPLGVDKPVNEPKIGMKNILLNGAYNNG